MHPVESIAAKRGPLAGLAAASVAAAIVLTVRGAPLRTDAAPHGIVSFEFAADRPTARAILQSWSGLYDAAAFNLYFDFLFLLLYSSAIALACARTATALRPRRARAAAFGVVLTWGQWLAGALDMVENVALLFLLWGSSNSSLPPLAFVCATIKFALVGLGLGYAGVGTLVARYAGPR